MKKITLFVIAVCSICLALSVTAKQPLKADTITISDQNHMYTKLDINKQTLKALIEAYEDLPKTQQVNVPIDWDTAVTITYVHDDQISATVAIDARGVFQTKDGVSAAEYDDDAHAFYMLARELFEAVHYGNDYVMCAAC